MSSNDSVVRLINLFELLSSSKRPLTQEEIQDKLPGMPEGTSARRQAFERSKADLKAMGIALKVVPLPGRSQVGYLVDVEAMVLDLSLSEEESSALSSALGCVRANGSELSTLQEKLGFVLDRDVPLSLGIGDLSVSASLAEASARRIQANFAYNGRPRCVYVYGLLMKWGRWYAAGLDVDKDELRVFRLDRIEGAISLDTTVRFERPSDFVLSSVLPDEPWQIEVEDPVEVSVRADEFAARVLKERDGAQGVENSSGGKERDFRFLVSNPDAFISDMLAFRDHVCILAPATLRNGIKRHLEAIIDNNIEVLAPRDSQWVSEVTDRGTQDSNARRVVRKFDLLKSLLTQLSRIRTAKLSELARQYGLGMEELVSLLESAATCGLPPYTPDQLYEILVDPEDDFVEVTLKTPLTLPRKINYPEAVLAIAAGKAIAAVLPDPQPVLQAALDKIAFALRGYLGNLDSVEIGLDPSGCFTTLRSALLTNHQLRVEYHSVSSDELTSRVLDPYRLFLSEGKWYLKAYCHRSGEVRIFKVERVLTAYELSTSFERPISTESNAYQDSEGFQLPQDAPWVTVLLDLQAMALLEKILGGRSRVGPVIGGKREVSFQVASTEWLMGFMLQLGPNLYGVSPADTLHALRSSAMSILSLYRD